jgi:hypothetical protein
MAPLNACVTECLRDWPFAVFVSAIPGIRYFIARRLVRCRGHKVYFGLAAARLNMSQTTLSQKRDDRRTP